MKQFFDYAIEVKQAIKHRKPILALESTIITHGLPYPDNLKTAQSLEQIARDAGVTPAIIAIMHGKIKIGLSAAELIELAQNKNAQKASKRDLSYMLTGNYSAGTTVAATLYCASAANIKVFATGGIGGVHRGDDYDISADLIELARTPMAVVCAGAKAILDLPRTLEFLETYSVPVIGYQTDYLPAFYTMISKHKLPMRLDNVKTMAHVLKTHWELGFSSGVLVTTPIPSENAIDMNIIEPVIETAIANATGKNINGKQITPFLLAEVAKATAGKSVEANIALIKNNVALGARLAAELHDQLA